MRNYLKRENGNIKDDGTEIDGIILPRMEDKPKNWNTQRDKGPLIKLMDSWITHELRRITLTKIDEIKLVYFRNKTQLAFIDENCSTYIGALTIRITKDT